MDPHKSLFRKVEKALQAIQRSSDASSTIAETASAVIENFQGELGVRGGRLYERRDGGYELTRVFGGSTAPPGIFVPDAYPPVQQVIDERRASIRSSRGVSASSASRRSLSATTSTSCRSRSIPRRRTTT
jgi:hypothetical protein